MEKRKDSEIESFIYNHFNMETYQTYIAIKEDNDIKG